MGSLSRFRCPECGYAATVSGGRDCGMVAVVRTMVCDDCRALADVLIGREGKDGPTGDAEYDRRLNICPRCHGTRVRPWKATLTCPRCDTRMISDRNFTLLWD